MKKKVLLLVGLLYSLLGLSQADDITATVEWAAPLPKTLLKIVHTDSSNIYYAGGVGNLFSMDEVFVKMRVTNMEKEIEIIKDYEKLGDGYPRNLGFKVKGKELHGFYTHYDKKSDIKSILVRKVIDENRESSDYKIIGSIESSKSYKTNLNYRWSENDSILMLVGIPERESKSDNQAVEFKVFDYNYDLMYECRIELDFEDRYFNIVSYRITNSGKILMLGSKMPNKRKGEKRDKEESNLTYYLYVYDVNKDELIEYDLGLKDKFITNVDLRSDFEGNKSVICGIYSDKSFYAMAGSFYISIDQSNYEVLSEKFNPFDKEFVELMTYSKSYKKKVAKGKEDEIRKRNVVIRNIIQKDDGGHLVVYEDYNYWTTTYVDQNGRKRKTDHNYSYNEIFVQNYTSEGEVVWTALIPKYQYTMNDGGEYSGFMLLVDQNRLHFIYNDHKKNEERWGTKKGQKVSRKFTKTNLVMVTLTEEGDLSYKVLMPSRVEKFLIKPRESRMIGSNGNKAILLAKKRTTTRFGKIELLLD
jgi:hypothetical protein